MLVIANDLLDLDALVKKASKYSNVDEWRAKRAAQIVRNNGVRFIVNQQTWYVESTSRDIIYKVSPHSCDCEDCQNGHVCKHRIAAWMTTQHNKESA